MPPFWKLLTGVAATFILANVAYSIERQPLVERMLQRVASIMIAHSVTDGSARLTDRNGRTWRIVSLSGTAAPATRAAITAEITTIPGIHSALWIDRR